MNRVRRVGNIYQCLISPHRKYDTGFEYLLGSWTDESMTGFEVRTYSSYTEAECEAIEMPDIDWDRLVEFHKESYLFLRDHLTKSLARIGIATDFKHYLATPIQAKNRMFDRVIKGNEAMIEKNITTGFRTVYNMNDIISFVVINPWTHNLKVLADRLIRTERLNIFNKIEKEGVIQLVGRTDIGTSYEILLMTSVVHNWVLWREKNENVTPDRVKTALKNCLKTQRLIDATPVLG
ncbi:hypothetical protein YASMINEVIRUS_999 [Yasminevirus sp. GU-2018]|uniref:Uncharacterized protein n=1 Tax=Yasminevirus sp. GU-2018 TaxID=2420051 RepID=A0A5K0UBN9_9VIRU|nr:hypothetical protein YASMINEVIRUS_999 [Yasminevirus sp. GU-2018]